MHNILKNILGGAAVLVLLSIVGLGYRFSALYDKSIEPSSFRSFTVSAMGEAVGIPDVATFTASVITEGGEDITSLQTKNTEKVNSVISFLGKNGVKKEDMKTRDYNVFPRYQYGRCDGEGACPPPEIVGYSINQTLFVRVRNLESAGELLSGAVQSGANSVSELTFTIDDPTEISQKARGEAIQKAQKKADNIAKAAGFRVGRLLSISESEGGRPPIYPQAEMMKTGGGEAPIIEPGSEEMQVTVSLTYEIK